jgi:hypothetical protein
MNDTAKLEISPIAAAFSLGILGDMLLRATPWGLNFALWGCALAASIALFRREVLKDGGQWLLLLMALSSLASGPGRATADFRSGGICIFRCHRGHELCLWDVSPAVWGPGMEKVAER